jgi:ubiquitin-conjugating enzyme E2 D/E
LSAAPIEENNFFNWEVTMTGPKGSKIPGIIEKEFSLTMTFTDSYPFEAPKIKFQDIPQGHPNIDANGTIDLYEVDFLGSGWSPQLTITKVLISICLILKDPAVPYKGGL